MPKGPWNELAREKERDPYSSGPPSSTEIYFCKIEKVFEDNTILVTPNGSDYFHVKTLPSTKNINPDSDQAIVIANNYTNWIKDRKQEGKSWSYELQKKASGSKAISTQPAIAMIVPFAQTDIYATGSDASTWSSGINLNYNKTGGNTVFASLEHVNDNLKTSMHEDTNIQKNETSPKQKTGVFIVGDESGETVGIVLKTPTAQITLGPKGIHIAGQITRTDSIENDGLTGFMSKNPLSFLPANIFLTGVSTPDKIPNLDAIPQIASIITKAISVGKIIGSVT